VSSLNDGRGIEAEVIAHQIVYANLVESAQQWSSSTVKLAFCFCISTGTRPSDAKVRLVGICSISP